MFIAWWLACSGVDPGPPASTCADEPVLFGAPSPRTGLDDGACTPACRACGFSPPAYGPDDVAALLAWTLLDPAPPPDVDPYGLPDPPVQADGVCAIVDRDPTASTYRLASFTSSAEAEADGAVITHGGGCGLCSSLEDLAVYMAQTDLTEPVRACGIDHVFSESAHLACLEDLGFSTPCAWIWLYNTRHTRAVCLDVCVALLDAPYHDADGAPNACIQCDEDESGPVFKAVAGRTRRNSGLPTALCRPCDSVFPVTHESW